jgi:hypothetical protein
MDESSENRGHVEVIWYGERGVVNALVAALREAGVSSVIALLESVEWACGSRPGWLGEVKSVDVIVEVGCGEFGDPDLIVICTTGDDQKFATFFEAKVVTYDSSAGSNQQGIRVKGYNSTINGQLSLKYRLAMALSVWNGHSNAVREPRAAYEAYRRPWSQGGLSDTLCWPRHLKKPTVLSIMREAGLASLPMSRFHFVALTWDREPFFRASAFHDSDLRPLFLDESGNERWHNTTSHLGWIGFGHIAKADRLARFLGDAFRKALVTMVPSLEPPDFTDSATATYPSITSYNIQRHSSKATVRRLRALEALAAEHFGKGAIKQSNGSSSVKFAGKVIVKLIPRNHGPAEFLLLGISASLRRNDWGGFTFDGPKLIGSASKAQPFFTIDLPNTDESLEMTNDILMDVADACGLGDGGQ